MNNRVCICDADFLIAQLVESDSNHSNTLQIAKRLVTEEAKVLIPIAM